jgi:hypothetical protein
MKAPVASILLVAVCTLTLAFAGAPAFAQDSAPPADKLSQAQIDAATDLLKANNSAANMQAMLDVILPLQAAEIRRQHPTASDETIKQLLKIVNDAISSHTDDLIRLDAIAYAKHFSVDEMHALASFYRTDVGQKYLKELPSLMKDVTPIAVAYLKSRVTQEVENAVAKLRQQGVKI